MATSTDPRNHRHLATAPVADTLAMPTRPRFNHPLTDDGISSLLIRSGKWDDPSEWADVVAEELVVRGLVDKGRCQLAAHEHILRCVTNDPKFKETLHKIGRARLEAAMRAKVQVRDRSPKLMKGLREEKEAEFRQQLYPEPTPAEEDTGFCSTASSFATVLDLDTGHPVGAFGHPVNFLDQTSRRTPEPRPDEFWPVHQGF
ncbi:hypothetical protein DRE_06477 [Drechslerella stenobrocha 248]|uniref:Uncharacterized protein n=1 Tax=Drechslerella stenobrocha 248 TaxID=1043628 RepID=W7HNG8_9PEZI|nr:hypothetical protein DRE_06477 [Drechslerella stenobrocha 248]